MQRLEPRPRPLRQFAQETLAAHKADNASRDDVGRELILDGADAVAQDELALLQALPPPAAAADAENYVLDRKRTEGRVQMSH